MLQQFLGQSYALWNVFCHGLASELASEIREHQFFVNAQLFKL